MKHTMLHVGTLGSPNTILNIMGLCYRLHVDILWFFPYGTLGSPNNDMLLVVTSQT